jgi:hypothetical protein
MCPLVVACNFGKCSLTAVVVRPGHDWKKPCLIACFHVDVTGLKAVACRNFISAGMLVVW